MTGEIRRLRLSIAVAHFFWVVWLRVFSEPFQTPPIGGSIGVSIMHNRQGQHNVSLVLDFFDVRKQWWPSLVINRFNQTLAVIVDASSNLTAILNSEVHSPAFSVGKCD